MTPVLSDLSAVSSHEPPTGARRVLADLPNDDPVGFAALLAKVEREHGFRCGSYKERCLLRRVGVRMRAVGAHSYAAYAEALDRDPREYERLVDALTINVTKLFRNWEAWEALAELAIPALWARGDWPLRVWSAGTASGEEAYSVAALLHRHAERVGELDRLGEVHVLGTDLDLASLGAAARGVYPPAAFADAPEALRVRYFGDGGAATPELRALVRFERHDLLRDPPPTGPFHLVVCRNVVIYFDRESQEGLFEHFHDALVPGGTLFLGKVEALLGRTRALFVPLEQRQRIFRRP